MILKNLFLKRENWFKIIGLSLITLISCFLTIPIQSNFGINNEITDNSKLPCNLSSSHAASAVTIEEGYHNDIKIVYLLWVCIFLHWYILIILLQPPYFLVRGFLFSPFIFPFVYTYGFLSRGFSFHFSFRVYLWVFK